MTASERPIADAASWLAALLSSELVQAICVIAIAVLGFALLSGRFSLRRGALVIVGCFMMFGAGTIAYSLVEAASAGSDSAPNTMAASDALPNHPTAEVQQSDDPYAGASLTRN